MYYAKATCADINTYLQITFIYSLQLPTETEPHLGAALRELPSHPGCLMCTCLACENGPGLLPIRQSLKKSCCATCAGRPCLNIFASGSRRQAA
jgi:hypothetical protein